MSAINASNVYLDEWQRWPIDVTNRPDAKPLNGEGTNNPAFLVSADEQHWVLRYHPGEPIYPVSREQEFILQNAAAEKGLAPRALYLDPEHRYSLCEFFDGQPDKKPSAAGIERLCNQLNQLQAIRRPLSTLPGYNYQSFLQCYWSEIDEQQRHEPVWTQRYQQAQTTIAEFQSRFGSQRCLSHHDLVSGNILWTKTEGCESACQLIDWEFAGLGIGSFDFATVGIEFQIATDDLASLCCYSPTELAVASEVYRHLCDFYFAACADKP